MSSYQERIAELARKVVGIDLRLASISDERKANAVEASQNGKTALQKIASLDVEADQLLRSKSTFTSAADQLDIQLKQEEAEALKLSAAERDAKVRKIGAAVVATQAEIDLALKQLAEMFSRREARLNELHRAGGIDSRTTFRLVSKETVSSAFAHAGLARYVALEPVPIQSQRPLNDSARIIPTPKDK